MSKSNSQSFSRRRWLGLTPTLAAASLGGGLLAQKAAAETPAAAAAGENIYDIRTFGAKGDGSTIDTAAVQSAIDAATQNNGGVVFVPAGNFLIGTIELKSN
ncbi:MAG TPA: glycosyl hydrolase family 28-related protein, partial [Desulfuromonadaceae bacterium]|nr:glycosyl hydrolase family 28-related protein [Desulfuromonadaceae bacterium]